MVSSSPTLQTNQTAGNHNTQKPTQDPQTLFTKTLERVCADNVFLSQASVLQRLFGSLRRSVFGPAGNIKAEEPLLKEDGTLDVSRRNQKGLRAVCLAWLKILFFLGGRKSDFGKRRGACLVSVDLFLIFVGVWLLHWFLVFLVGSSY